MTTRQLRVALRLAEKLTRQVRRETGDRPGQGHGAAGRV